MILGMIYKQTASIKGAQIIAFGSPMIPGYGLTNGVSFVLQDKTGGDLNKFYKVAQDYLAALNKRPEFSRALTTYNPNYPQYMVDVDVAKGKTGRYITSCNSISIAGILWWYVCFELQRLW